MIDRRDRVPVKFWIAVFLWLFLASLCSDLAFGKACAQNLPGQILQPPQALWDQWRPVKVLIDATVYNGTQSTATVPPLSTSVVVENGWLFVSHWLGFRIYSLTDPANPSLVGNVARSKFLYFPPTGEVDQYIRWIDAPAGDDSVVAVGGYDAGFSVWSTTDKATPVIKYQDATLSPNQIYAAKIGAKRYAFSSKTTGGTGVQVYDLDAAIALPTPCLKRGTSNPCPAVRVGSAIPSGQTIWVHGMAFSGRHFIAASNGISGATGQVMSVWDVSAPASPVKIVGRSTTSGELSAGVAMFEQGGRAYLALRGASTLSIYDLTVCLTSGCAVLPPPVSVSVQAALSLADSSKRVTFSRSGDKPILHLGHAQGCFEPHSPGQTDYYLDVSNPNNPLEISPTTTMIDNGERVGYWSWYYSITGGSAEANIGHGFSMFWPQMGVFHGSYLYRAGHSITDVHWWSGGGGVPPPDPDPGPGPGPDPEPEPEPPTSSCGDGTCDVNDWQCPPPTDCPDDPQPEPPPTEVWRDGKCGENEKVACAMDCPPPACPACPPPAQCPPPTKPPDLPCPTATDMERAHRMASWNFARESRNKDVDDNLAYFQRLNAWCEGR